MTETVLDVNGLAKTFTKPFTGKKVDAVRGVTFDVTKGEIASSSSGPNGAGKTTTIKMLTGLIAPTRRTGDDLRDPGAVAGGRWGGSGFLPENPYDSTPT